MSRYVIEIDDQDKDAEGGGWTATLYEKHNDGTLADTPISAGIGHTVREAVRDIDFHHEWTRHLIDKDNRAATH